MGLMRNIVVVPYDARWPTAFDAESQLIRQALGPLVLELYHVGSTSVPGLAAKPIIDMLLVVTHHAALDAANPALIQLGYEPKGEHGIPGRRLFVKGGDASRTHHIHAYEPGHYEIATHLDLRDYLRTHPDAAHRYAALKVDLAPRHRDDIEAYMAGKAPLIAELLARAAHWRRQGARTNLRRAAADDAPQLARIHVTAWQAAYRDVVPATFLAALTYEKREAVFRQAIAADTEETYLAEQGDRAMGILTIGPCRDADLDTNTTGEIWGIYLLPDQWRRGLGTRLLHQAEHMLWARGRQAAVLWVLEGNLGARRFYEAMGYWEDGVFKLVELGQTLKAIRYHKALPLVAPAADMIKDEGEEA